MRQVYTLMRIVAIIAGLAAMLYALYVRLVGDPLGLFSNLTAGVIVAVLAIAALLALALPGKRQPPLVGREVTGAPPPRARVVGLAAFGILVAVYVALTFSSYLNFATYPANVPGMDRYGPMLPYGILAVAALFWLADSLFGRIVTGTATGKSPTGQRFLLIGKRVGVFALIAAILIVLHVQFTRLYPDARSQLALALGLALIASVFLIARQLAFTPRRDGDVI